MTGGDKTALVLGATGALGAAATRALLAHGWTVRALARDIEAARRSLPDLDIAWISGDANNLAEVAAACAGARVLFHGANPRRYKNWRGLAIPMLANAIAAAEAAGARLIFPGNIYNFGPDAWPLLAPDSPQHPLTRKGAVRVEMEEMLRQASTRGLRCVIVRAGDFFGPGYTDSWLGQVILKDGRAAKAIQTLGPAGAGHAWAYLPDLAETIARLADSEQRLPAFARYHFGGQWIASTDDLVAALRKAVGRPDLPRKAFFWPMVYVAAPFVGFLRELLEMRYIWREPIRLDNASLVAAIGEEPHTPLDVALARTFA